MEPTPLVLALLEAKNPEYACTEIDNVFPFRVDAEMIGDTAGRIYLRDKNRLIAVTSSDYSLRKLRDRLTEILDA